MGRRARILCWVVAVGALGAPYVRRAATGWEKISLSGVPLPSAILVPSLIAIPIALVGAWLAFRNPEGRRPRFRLPVTRSLDYSLAAFALFAVGIRLTFFLRLFGTRVPAGSGALDYAVPLFVLLWAWRSLGRRELEDAWGLGLGTRPAREALVGLLALAWLLPLWALFAYVATQLSAADLSRWPLAYKCTNAILIAPVVEEVFFRGVLYTALRRTLGWIGAACAVALLFVILHRFNPSMRVPVSHFAFGFVLCLVREWRGSLVACIIAHSLLNAVHILPYIATLWSPLPELPS
jgi:membrane protease YdiL (CAAX protease family)